MDIHLINTGFFYADGGAMFGAVPKTAWSRRYPSDELNRCKLAMHCCLILTDVGRVILVDTGVDKKQLGKLDYYGFEEGVDLLDELLSYGIEPSQVTDVVLTHLHFDHCGYVTWVNPQTGSIKPTFPKATYWVSEQQWENAEAPCPLEKDSYLPENMQAVEEANQLRLINHDTYLSSGVELRLYDGHTPGQIVPYIASGEGTIVFAGDVIPLAASVSPAWISAYDLEPTVSYSEKIRMLEEAARERQHLVFGHDAYTPFGKVEKINGFYKAIKD